MIKNIWGILMGVMGLILLAKGVEYIPILCLAIGYLMLDN